MYKHRAAKKKMKAQQGLERQNDSDLPPGLQKWHGVDLNSDDDLELERQNDIDLPPGLQERHGVDDSNSDDDSDFETKCIPSLGPDPSSEPSF